MKNYIKGIFLIAIIILSCGFIKKITNPISIKIDILKEQIIDESISQKVKPGYYLFDDQDKVPTYPDESIKEIDAINNDTWIPTRLENKTSMYIDLQGEYKITHVAYKDVAGNSKIRFSQGSPFHWAELFTNDTNKYNEWVVVPVSASTRYIQIASLNGWESGVSEVALYGYKVKDIIIDNKEAEKTYTKTTIDKFVGINAFIDDPIDILKVAGTIREYHNFSWTLSSLHENKFNPSSNGYWNFDEYYKNLKQANIDVVPCIQGNAGFMLDRPAGLSSQIKPIDRTKDATDPKSYAIHASGMFQYAARYGSKVVDDSRLELGSNQTRVSGLNYLSYFENWNEPDKTWEGRDGYFHPYEFAAMTSADYDGHESTLGSDYGIKNADSDAKLVLGGVAGSENLPKYLDLMKSWFENNRSDKKLAFDVINFHYYAGKTNPENSNFVKVCDDIANWRDENAPDKEVWLTEFGWDTNVNSPLGAPDLDTQRDWLVRSYLLALKTGVDRATMFMIRDTGGANNQGKYGTSGLTTQKGSWNKKSAWYGVYTLKETLSDYQFDKVILEENVYIYKFKKNNSNEIAYAIWSPTSDNTIIKDYKLYIGLQEKASITMLVDKEQLGLTNQLVIENGKIVFDVNESPIFIKTTEEKTDKTELQQIITLYSTIKNNNVFEEKSWTNFTSILTEANKILNDLLVTQEEINKMYNELLLAYSSLEKIVVKEENKNDETLDDKENLEDDLVIDSNSNNPIIKDNDKITETTPNDPHEKDKVLNEKSFNTLYVIISSILILIVLIFIKMKKASIL